MSHLQVNLIWAQGRNRVIGLNGVMPWHIPEDLAHFKQTTQGHPVIMGRKTWDSLPEKFRPLPLRKNIVLTRQRHWGQEFNNPLVIKADSIESAISANRLGADVGEVWVVGGAQIYELYLPMAHRVEITEIDETYQGDTFAPELGKDWIEINRRQHQNANGLRFDFVTYQNTSNLKPIQSTLLF